MMWTQSPGFSEGIVKSVSTSTSMDHETKNSGIVPSQETLPVEAAESMCLANISLARRKHFNFFVALVLLINQSFTLPPPNHPQMHGLIHAAIQKFV